MKILVVQLSFIGDCILSTHLPEAIAVKHPGAEVWVLTTPIARAVFTRNPHVAGVLTFDKRKGEKGILGLLRKAAEIRAQKFDQVYSLHRSGRTSVLLALARIPKRIGFVGARAGWLYHERRVRPQSEHDVIRNASLLGDYETVASLPLTLTVIPPDEALVKAETRKEVDSTMPLAVLFPGSAWHTKRWHAKGFREVAESLIAQGVKVLVLGAPPEQAGNREVSDGLEGPMLTDLTGKTGLDETVWLTSKAHVVVCNDSMALHLASALKIPAVVVFCATSPFFGFGPWKNRAAIIQLEELWCKPCRRHGSPQCPTGTELCMTKVSSQQVIQAIARVSTVFQKAMSENPLLTEPMLRNIPSLSDRHFDESPTMNFV